jgi:hypothetical protein
MNHGAMEDRNRTLCSPSCKGSSTSSYDSKKYIEQAANCHLVPKGRKLFINRSPLNIVYNFMNCIVPYTGPLLSDLPPPWARVHVIGRVLVL